MANAIVITGGSRGIGASVARLAGKRGWSVVVNYASDREAAEATAAAVEAAGGKAIVVKGDVAVEADVVTLFDAATAAFGQIDGVANNAGIVVSPPQQFVDMSVDRFQRILATNVMGAWLVAREAVRRMAKGRGGHGGAIVNVSSAAARLGGSNEYVDYAATKGAIESLTIGLSREAGREGIRVNAVRPGLIETDIHASGGQPGRAQRLGADVPIGRPGTPQEAAAAIVWLLSDEASYVNGAILDVTGGR